MYFIQTPRRLFPICTVLMATILSTGCSSTKSLESTTPASAVTIDAHIEDWNDVVRKVDDEAFSMGVLNDDEYLYVALYFTDQQSTSQIMRNGLILWLDHEGGKKKNIGIRFPLGMAAGDRPQGQRPNATGRAAGDPSLNPEIMSERLARQTSEVEILLDGDEHGNRFQIESVLGLDVKASVEYGALIYEMRIPLQKGNDYSYAVGAEPGAVIGLGIETPEVNREVNRPSGGGAGFGGRGGGGGGAGFGGGGGGRGGARPGGGARGMQSAQPISVWASVTLAG